MSMFHELMMRKKGQIMYATIKGSLTESPYGVFSGFSTSNYLALQQSFKLNADTVAEIVFKFNATSVRNGYGVLSTFGSYGILLNFNNLSKLALYIGDGTGSSFNILNGTLQSSQTISANTDYWGKLKFDKGVVSLLISTDGINYSGNNTTITLAQEYVYNLTYGIGRIGASYFRGSIDLNRSYIKLGSTKYNLQAVVGYTIVGSPTIVDGVVSGFSASDYLTTNKTFPSDLAIANGFKFKTKFSVANLSTPQQVIQFYLRGTSDGVRIGTSGRLDLFVGGAANVLSTSSGFIQPNQIYTVSGELINGILNLYVDNVLVATKQFTDIVLQPQKNVYFGRIFADADPSALSGTLYIAETNIEIGNKLWFNGQQA